ncbi:conserved hypothetical protein [Verticillium alfalfae VaMs.102]|uniref:Uncharacterized protein n=1 Tax=Verticillium alfalfae (strain VaMs.102 / ATCC MYA-4576 / FGSC 10136) TaxID=526221 RepID=C9S6L3_VERA1|nr:conserved hypothetical protein [Verticillium alfalfae VaMs.102]EEY14504.1 conserved hypothetical protein [Verticillium alfalfae VaMs.102]
MSTRRSARLSAQTATKSEVLGPVAAPNDRKRKTAQDTKLDEVPSPAPAVPATPPRKRTQRAAVALPVTPTPSAVSLIAERINGTAEKPRTAAVSRFADPNRTNAPLLSPESSRLVAPALAVQPSSASPSKAARLAPTSSLVSDVNSQPTTTENILAEACAHLIRVDPRMKALIDKHLAGSSLQRD